ncbi:MAG: CusA/CzcA family heavy metal efflux RND transporter [Candidatus Brocadiaceae bacterium]|nr:CusA/CzcA family heavy metal efflux RND transporter [Candidatus Brocadiaceae bacterium]
MLERILQFSIQQRWIILFATLAVAVLGIFNYQRLPIDAVPDITNVQVQIHTEATGYTPLEVEQRITFPIEASMSGIPGLAQTRSISRYGLSQITVIFQDDTDIYFARQLINERIQGVKGKIPPAIEPIMGPIATGLGEIFMWTVETEENALKPDGNPYTPMDLRTIQDWVIKPQLRNIKGVTEINTVGGYEKEFHVTPHPEKLLSYGMSFRDVLHALASNNATVGAGYIEHRGEQYLIRSPGQVATIEDIRKIIIGNFKGIPIYIKDVAEVLIGKELRTGAATVNGKETVLGTVFMLMGENSRTVSQSVADKIIDINKTLPEGVIAKTIYDRTSLVDKTIITVKKNLIEGALLVIVILFFLIGNIRAAIITALIIPLSMLITITGMVSNKISASLMSLGALDFGIIIDGAVIIVENCIRRLSEKQHQLGRLLTRQERFDVVFDASKEVRKATMFGEIIIMIVFLPILTLTGIEGKMFYPMAFTVIVALLGAMVLSMTFVPAAIALFFSGKFSEKENVIIRYAKKAYIPILNMALENRAFVIALVGVIVVLGALLTTRMGSEFLPSLDEGDITIHALRIPGTSLSQALEMQQVLENKIKEFPEVDNVFSKIGTAEIATDPMPPSVADTFIILKPRAAWPAPEKSKDKLIRELEEELAKIPGNKYEFTQPIEMRFNELIAGVRSDIAVKIFGDTMETLHETGERVARVLKEIPGASDVKAEQVTGLPVLTIQMNRDEMARHGLNIADVQEVIEIAIGGKSAGKVFEGDRRFELLVRLPAEIRSNIEALKRLPVPLPDLGGTTEARFAPVTFSEKEIYPSHITLGSIATFTIQPGPNQISRENGKRRVVVTANVRGRDIGSFVDEAQKKISEGVILPPNYWITWGGQFEHMLSAKKRLQIVAPIAFFLIFLLLFVTFGTIKNAILVFTGVPFALIGGVFSLWARDIPLSISAGVGFVAVSGVAVLNGLVMISFISKLRKDGIALNQSITQGAITRLRPVLMTVTTDILGFVPMALATGTGAEVQRPLATVVIGGVMSSTALTLLVLPVLYHIFHRTDVEERPTALLRTRQNS